MARKHRWFWVVLFIVTVLLIGSLATGWNVVLVRDYQKLIELARLRSREELAGASPWVGITLGSLGFLAALSGLALFFVKVLREMRLNQLQSEFVAAVSHELKTPLATLELTSSLLRDSQPATEDEKRRLWASHSAELKRLREQVESLLEAARWQLGTIKPLRSRIHLGDWLTATVARWAPALGPGSLLALQGDALNCWIDADPRLLDLMIDSLLDNARKFSKDKTNVELRAELVEAQKSGARPRWRLEVRDCGWGFDSSDARKIFQRFYRAKPMAPYAIPGTGLGLFLAASAGKAMGIRISGSSEGSGSGSVFTLEGSCAP